MKKTIDEILHEAANLFQSRNTEYGNAFKNHPKLMYELLGPVNLETVEDFERFTRISSIVAKLNRYCKNFKDNGHHDSARDMVVFSAMLQEIHENEQE